MAKHSTFEDWKRTVQAQNCAPDRDTINKMMKDWESDRDHLKNESEQQSEITKLNDKLKAKTQDFEDILNYGWGLLYPGETDWDYPGQVINHLWAEVNTQKNLVTTAENKYKLTEPIFMAIDMAMHGDVTVRATLHREPDGKIVVDKIEEL